MFKAYIQELEAELEGMVSQDAYEPEGNIVSLDAWLNAVGATASHPSEVQTGRSQAVQAVGALVRAKAILIAIEDEDDPNEREVLRGQLTEDTIRGWKYYALAMKQQAHSSKIGRLYERQSKGGRPIADREADVALYYKVKKLKDKAKAEGKLLGIASACREAGYSSKSNSGFELQYKRGKKEAKKLRP